MPTRKLTDEQRSRIRPLLERVRESLKEMSGDDPELLFAYRRKIAKELNYDERGKPAKRRALRLRKFNSQEGSCPLCGKPLPPSGFDAILDKLDGMGGYTERNVRLIHRECDLRTQRERAFTG